MESRGGETPMEFEWDSGHGPSDITSPFMQITQKLGTKRGFESPIKNPSQPHNPPTQNQPSFFGGGAFGASATPAKAFRNPGFEPTPSRLGQLQAQSKPTPFRDAPFTTPRKPFDSPYFSEATGDESSPGLLGDNEDTPETRPGRSTQIKAFSSVSAIKPKEGGLFGRYGKLSHSPGRGEIRRGNKYDTSNPQRVMKRRRMDREREQILTHSRRSSFDSDSEISNQSTNRPAKATTLPVPQPGMLASFFGFISAHPELPSTIAKWAQLFMNFCFGLLALYLAYAVLAAIRGEVEIERLKAIDVIQSEIAHCVAEYTKNNCAGHNRAPALDAFCRMQEDCFGRDPERVGRARVSAGTFSMIINNFFEGFSLKTSAILIGGAAVFVVASNMGFSAAKQKLHDNPTAFMPGYANQGSTQQGWDPRPAEVWFQQLPALQGGGMTPGRAFATPARGMRGERGMGNEGWGEEFRAIMPSGSPMKSPRKQSRH